MTSLADSIPVQSPLSPEEARKLRAGDRVLLSGVIYGARDVAHRRIVEALERGEEPPIPLQDQVIYYVGPTPGRPGAVIGSAGPTTAVRMDPFTPTLLRAGVRGLVGKGARGAEVRRALEEQGAVYFVAVGGAAALLASRIHSQEVVAYPELGTEAVRKLEVRDFPLVVANDVHGGDLFRQGRASFEARPKAP